MEEIEKGIKLPHFKCSRCGHTWIPRGNSVMCPRCKSHLWNKPANFDKRFKNNERGLKENGSKRYNN